VCVISGKFFSDKDVEHAVTKTQAFFSVLRKLAEAEDLSGF